MSYYEISIDNGPLEKQKSSGITICTGTGSTSWYVNSVFHRSTESDAVMKSGENEKRSIYCILSQINFMITFIGSLNYFTVSITTFHLK